MTSLTALDIVVIKGGVLSMLAELEIVPIGTKCASISAHLVEVARLIAGSGLDYRLGAMGTVLEGDWDRIMHLARQCHEVVLRASDRVITTIRLDDRKDKPGPGRIMQKVESLEAKVGQPLRR